MLKIELLLIDPQNDFCDQKGSLYVPGAEQDMYRVAAFIKKHKKNLSDIHVTLDSHHFVDVAHPIMYKDIDGKHPAPFTLITSKDLKDGVWNTTKPYMKKRFIEYTEALEKNNRYALCIWPPHCLIGSWGAMVYPEVFEALLEWEQDFAIVDYVTKGSNFWTEHYSAVQAEVPDPNDPGTALNIKLIQPLAYADMILVMGEASSHCTKFTVEDTINNFGPENIKKMVLLTDCMSPVTGFEQQAEDFFKDFIARGGRVSTSKDVL